MSKKDYRKGLLNGRHEAAKEIDEYTQNFITIAKSRGTQHTAGSLLIILALSDARDASLGNLNYDLNKTKTDWKKR